MGAEVTVLAFSGSLRPASHNTRALRLAILGAEAAGARVTTLDLAQHPLPLFDGDYDPKKPLPEMAQRLQAMVKAHDALLIASPEYNGGMAPLVKSTLDWLSRPDPALTFKGKVAALLSASPERSAGLIGVAQLAAVLQHMGVVVAPWPMGIGQAHEAFDEHGDLRDKNLEARVRASGGALVELTHKLRKGLK